ncbi:coiled-coil domain-containing protein 43 [Ambystoma mexicanum]|uniref:coiled-coil domain-containing protein 43 n=1 Tax=Ambystoma mexicanum TaxID=8296 RepID=UPI0037E7104E
MEAAAFEGWLERRLDALEIDGAVYTAYINGVLREEESDGEKLEALQGVLAAFLEEDSLDAVCQEIFTKWCEWEKASRSQEKKEDEIQAIANMMEKQAQIVVKPKEVTEEDKRRKAAVLAQYANLTDEEDEVDEEKGAAATVNIPLEKSLFKNTNLEDVMNARKLEKESLREDAQKKKEQDKMQREKDKLVKQERKEKEKKRTQKGERKR